VTRAARHRLEATLKTDGTGGATDGRGATTKVKAVQLYARCVSAWEWRTLPRAFDIF